MEKGNKISKILISEKKIKSKILSYLNMKEKFNLIQTSKLLNSYFKKEEKEIKKEKFKLYLKKNDAYKKKRKVHKINYLKNPKSFENFIKNSNFEVIYKTEQKQALKKIIPKKLQEESTYIHFYSQDLKKYIILRRVWLDTKLNLIKQKTKPESKIQINEIIEEINNKTTTTNYYLKHKKLQKKLKSLKKSEKDSQSPKLVDFFKIQKLAIIMFQGGDFSLVIYNNYKEIKHTSQHKYIIRKKGGGKKQSQKDRTKKIASIGSQIRRENEKILLVKIKESFLENKELIEECDLVLFFAPGENMGTVLGFFRELGIGVGNVRSLGMDVGKAKYKEVVNCYEKLTKIFVA